MRVFFCDHHRVPLPEGHVFPMEKYAELRRALLEEGVLGTDEVSPAPLAQVEQLELVHDASYIEAMLSGRLEPERIRRLGFPWSEELCRRSLASVGGTLAAARSALEFGAGGNLAGGTHHAHRDFGAGYCVFNDIAVAARTLQAEGAVRRVLVFDVDVHQGDGTAAIFEGDDQVFTLSIHGAKNFPARKMQSDLDLSLADGTEDATYLAMLDRALEECFSRFRPDLVFYQGGVDCLANDRFGRMAVTLDGLRERDQRALSAFRERDLPFVLTLGGGYSRPIGDTVEAHLNTYRIAKAIDPRFRPS